MVLRLDLEARVPVSAAVAAAELTKQTAASTVGIANKHVVRKLEAFTAAIDE